MKNIIGNLSTCLAIALLMSFGLAYLSRNSFMPYHSAAIGLAWENLDPPMRMLILAMMRAIAGGFIASAFAMLFLQIKFNTSRLPWIPFLVLALGTILASCLLFATSTIIFNTPGRPPVIQTVIGEALLITGYIFNMRELKKGGEEPHRE
jgi:hypothetical protein